MQVQKAFGDGIKTNKKRPRRHMIVTIIVKSREIQDRYNDDVKNYFVLTTTRVSLEKGSVSTLNYSVQRN
jgi:hypothetical protein